jgi:hypothetical protein
MKPLPGQGLNPECESQILACCQLHHQGSLSLKQLNLESPLPFKSKEEGPIGRLIKISQQRIFIGSVSGRAVIEENRDQVQRAITAVVAVELLEQVDRGDKDSQPLCVQKPMRELSLFQ